MTKLTQFSLPVPAGTKISSEYGERAMGSRNHYGIDFSVLSGVKIKSAGSGEVIRVIENHAAFGNVVIVKHSDDQATLYAHLSEIKINVGDEVNKSTVLGLSGSTGRSTGPHLHFEVIEGENFVSIIKSTPNPSIGIYNKDGRQNPRQYFEHYTDAEFSATVVPGSSSFGTTSGDSRDNTIYANSRQNTLEGLAGSDTYYFPTLSGSDQIVDSDLDGTIQIGSTILSGNALPKTDSEGNAIDGVWSLSSFDLHKSASGTDLIIVKAGADISASNIGSVTVADFPFSNSRGGFGITLGKKLDLIDRDIFTTQLIDSQLQGGFSLASSKDGFFGILKHVIGTSYFGSDDVVFFDSYGNQVASRGLKDAFQEMVSGDLLAPALDGLKASNPYSYEVNGKRYFASNVGERGYDSSSGLSHLYSRVGAILFDDDGNIINSHIYQNVKDGENPYQYVVPFGFYVSRENPEDLYYVYSAQNSRSSSLIVAQKVDKLTLDQIGNLIEYSATIWNSYSGTIYQGASLATPQPNSQEFTLGNDVEISLSGAIRL